MHTKFASGGQKVTNLRLRRNNDVSIAVALIMIKNPFESGKAFCDNFFLLKYITWSIIETLCIYYYMFTSELNESKQYKCLEVIFW